MHKHYIEGFLLVVPTKKLPAYRRLARLASQVWIEHGALDYRETVGDDLSVSFGLPFSKLLSIKKTDTVVLAWIVYASKAARKRISAKVMADPRLAAVCNDKNMPFNPATMSWGGFRTLVHRSAP